MNKYPIVEMFESIQGEGNNLGERAFFIRLAGCNLNCSWCDTKWDVFTEMLTVEEILDRIPTDILVVITGGEPFIYEYLDDLVISLLLRKNLVAIETNGTLDNLSLKGFWNSNQLWIACSPKPEKQWSVHPLCHFNELKFVIDEQITAEDIALTAGAYDVPIWLQPEGSNMKESWKKALEIQSILRAKKVYAKVGVQLHKIMEVR